MISLNLGIEYQSVRSRESPLYRPHRRIPGRAFLLVPSTMAPLTNQVVVSADKQLGMTSYGEINHITR